MLAERPLWRSPQALPPEAEALRAEVRTFVAEQIAVGTISASCDSWLSGWDPEFSKELGRRGWLGMTLPTQYGGGGRSSLERFVVVEELLAAGAPVSAHWVADRQTAAAILRFGTEEQRETLLPRICRGECYIAIGMSEPEAGSDLAAVRTRAVRDGDGWRVSGTKVWTSGAHKSHYMVTLCRTEDLGDDRHAGLTQLIIDLESPGLTIRPILLMNGEHHFNEVHLDNVFVPDSLVLGQPGDGWKQVVSELAYERSGPERFLSTMPLLVELVRASGSSPDARQSAALGALVSRLWSIRQLSLGVACALNDGANPEVEAAVVKDLGTRYEREVITGVRASIDVEPDAAGTRLARLLAEAVTHAPGFTLRGGANEILRTIISKQLSLR